jgi:hypothetical protein
MRLCDAVGEHLRLRGQYVVSGVAAFAALSICRAQNESAFIPDGFVARFPYCDITVTAGEGVQNGVHDLCVCLDDRDVFSTVGVLVPGAAFALAIRVTVQDSSSPLVLDGEVIIDDVIDDVISCSWSWDGQTASGHFSGDRTVAVSADALQRSVYLTGLLTSNALFSPDQYVREWVSYGLLWVTFFGSAPCPVGHLVATRAGAGPYTVEYGPGSEAVRFTVSALACAELLHSYIRVRVCHSAGCVSLSTCLPMVTWTRDLKGPR